MNKENILKVADGIEKHSVPDLGFNMRFFCIELAEIDDGNEGVADHSGHDCGTVACIAGWSNAIRTGGRPEEIDPDEEAEWLGLSQGRADALFFPHLPREEWAAISQDQAIRTLRHLAETGEVDWSVTP